MSELSSPALALIGIIVITVAVPKYFQLPESLELLFHDRMGQILLLGLAAVIGSYNFPVGLMLAVFFMSLMVTKSVQEGFEDVTEDVTEDDLAAQNNNLEPDVDVDMPEEGASEVDVLDTEPTMDPNMESDLVEEPVMDEIPEEFEDTTKTKSAKSAKKDNTMCQFLGKQVKQLEKKMKSLKCNQTEEKENNSVEEEKNNSNKNENGDLEEGFGCGCGGLDDRRKKHNYLVQNGQIEPFRNAPNQGSSDFDVVACRYDLKPTAQSEDIYGPPLSSCQAYQAVNLEETGTVFYPLN